MTIHHRQHSPVLIIGHARSGTSILADLLRRYLRISFGTESQFIIRYAKRVPQYGDLSVDANVRRLVEDIAKERCFQRWHKFNDFVLDPDQFYRDIPKRSYRGVLDAAFLQLAKHSHMTRWGDKTPEYNYHLPELYKLFPDAKYIHIVRDGRDVALSTFQKEFGAKNIYTAASLWKTQLLKIYTFAHTMSAQQLLEIRYEDLLSKTDHVWGMINDFLNVQLAPEDWDSMLAGSHEELEGGNFNKWKQVLPTSQQYLYERVAGDILGRYGYETRIQETPEIPLPERLYWMIDNHLRRWMRRAYWTDSLYKAALRIRGAQSFLRNRAVHTSSVH